jgi:hypothetical protein
MCTLPIGQSAVLILAEYLDGKSRKTLEASILETAMFLESEFGIRMTDQDLDLAYLGSPEAIEEILIDRTRSE